MIASSERNLTALEAVAWYKQLIEVEHSFRNLKDVLAMRPIYHPVEPRVQAQIFVAAPAHLLQWLLKKRLDQAGLDLSEAHAMQAVETIRLARSRHRHGGAQTQVVWRVLLPTGLPGILTGVMCRRDALKDVRHTVEAPR